jgi:hypothetical protein
MSAKLTEQFNLRLSRDLYDRLRTFQVTAISQNDKVISINTLILSAIEEMITSAK